MLKRDDLAERHTTRRPWLRRLAKERHLTLDELRKLGRIVSAQECAALGIFPAAEGFLLNYPNSEMQRIRYFEPQRNGQRYGQRAGSLVEAYFSPLWPDWEKLFSDVSSDLLITEGEYKSSTTCKLGLPCVGLGGVFNFASKRLKQTWLPSLERIQWAGRTVYIIFDSDSTTNPMVGLAETRLALRLTERGATVYIVRLPSEGAKKIGLDDYIHRRGRNARRDLVTLMVETKPFDKDLPLQKLNDELVYVPRLNAVVQIESGHVMRPHDFVNDIYADRQHTVSDAKDKEKLVSTPKAWMHWPGRRTADDITFVPGQPLFFNGRLNQWRGYAAEPAKGDVQPFLDLLDHVFRSAQPKDKQWFISWAAYPIQHPGAKLRTAVMLHGVEQGTGKTLLGETIAALYGDAGKLIGQEQLEREFNEYMDCAAFVVGDEVTTRGNKRDTAERLKNLVTRPYATINKKYQPVYTLPNVAQFFLTSNHDDALHLEDKDRRFFVHHVDNAALPAEFTKRFAQWQSNTDWRGALLHYLMYQVDCGDFDPYEAAPVTEAKQEMIATGLTDLDNWVRQLPNAPVHPDSLIIRRVEALHTAEELRMLAFGPNTRYSLASVGLAMRKAGFKRAHEQQHVKIMGRLITLWPTVQELGPRQLAELIAVRRAGPRQPITRVGLMGADKKLAKPYNCAGKSTTQLIQ